MTGVVSVYPHLPDEKTAAKKEGVTAHRDAAGRGGRSQASGAHSLGAAVEVPSEPRCGAGGPRGFAWGEAESRYTACNPRTQRPECGQGTSRVSGVDPWVGSAGSKRREEKQGPGNTSMFLECSSQAQQERSGAGSLGEGGGTGHRSAGPGTQWAGFGAGVPGSVWGEALNSKGSGARQGA